MTVAAEARRAPQDVRPLWEADLVAGALRDELHLAGIAGELIASNVSIRSPDGKVAENVGGGMGNVAFEQAFADSDAVSIDKQIRSAAAQRSDVKVRSVTTLRALQPAPAVVVSGNDPKQLVAERDTIFSAIFGDKPKYEGVYLEADDSSGEPVFIRALSYRTGGGMAWIRPDLDPRALFFDPNR